MSKAKYGRTRLLLLGMRPGEYSGSCAIVYIPSLTLHDYYPPPFSLTRNGTALNKLVGLYLVSPRPWSAAGIPLRLEKTKVLGHQSSYPATLGVSELCYIPSKLLDIYFEVYYETWILLYHDAVPRK